MSIREIEISPSQPQKTTKLPVIIKWKGENMIRTHSIRSTVKEILQVIKAIDVVQINIIGNQSTGKTTLARVLGHLIHKMSDIPFSVREFTKEDLLNFEKTLKSLSPTNYVLIFDDLSFMGASASKKQIEIVKQAMTEIRHLEGGQDVKIIMVKISHYTLGVDKYIRQNDFSFFTTVGSSELENMERIVGSKNMPKVHEFRKIYNSSITRKKFQYRLGKKGFFPYNYKNPFIPLLFWNNDSLRNIVSPSRDWIDPICSVCLQYTGEKHFESEINIGKWKIESDGKFGESTFKAAIRLKLYENGITVLDPRVVSAKRYLDRALEMKKISLEEIANHYGFKITNTKLRKKFDGEMTMKPLEPEKPKNE